MSSNKFKNYEKVLEILSDEKISGFITNNLKESLKSIGFSDFLVEDLILNIKTLDDNFLERWQSELNEVYTKGFFQGIVPAYFSQYVVPLIPPVKTILDIGCGTGILAHVLSKNPKFEKLVGIDLEPYPEWNKFSNSKVEFHIVTESEFLEFINREKPEAITLTWTLHHMELAEQEKYLSYLHKTLGKGTKIIILEDSYSNTLQPLKGMETYNPFMKWSEKERRDIMFVYCWLANRVLARRDKVPIPSSFRTLEEWRILFNKLNYFVESESFIGFPENRDINTPQVVIVISVA